MKLYQYQIDMIAALMKDNTKMDIEEAKQIVINLYNILYKTN